MIGRSVCAADACVVDQDVETSREPANLPCRASNRVIRGHIELHVGDVRPIAGQLLHGFLAAPLVAGAEQDPPAQLSKPAGGLTPEALFAPVTRTVVVPSVMALPCALARYPADRDLRLFIDELRTGSDRFRQLWDQGRPSTWRSICKTILHPDAGPLELDCDTLLVPDSDQWLIVYSAAGDSTAAAGLELLRVTGKERMSAR